MYPSTLLADPSLRLAGAQFRAHQPRARRVAVGGRRSTRYVRRQRTTAPRRRRRWSWLALAAVLALAVAALAFLRVWPPLATVMSASMEPTIKTGDIVVLKKLDGPAQVGDIVAISVPEQIRTRYGYPPVIIHRIVRIDADDVVTSKGDAYKEADPFEVPRSALTTKVVATLPAAGRLLGFLGSGLGLMWLAGGGLLFVAMPLLDRYRDGQRREQDVREDVQTTLRSVTEELALLRDARDRELEDAVREAESAREQLRVVNAALTRHLEDLPAQIERAVAAAVASMEPPPAPPPPPVVLARAAGFVAASQWTPPAPARGTWDEPPVPRSGRFEREALQAAAA